MKINRKELNSLIDEILDEILYESLTAKSTGDVTRYSNITDRHIDFFIQTINNLLDIVEAQVESNE